MASVSGPPSPGKPVRKLMRTTINSGTPTMKRSSAINPPANNIDGSAEYANVSCCAHANSLIAKAPSFILPRSRGRKEVRDDFLKPAETEYFPVFSRKSINHLGLILSHIHDGFFLRVLISRH